MATPLTTLAEKAQQIHEDLNPTGKTEAEEERRRERLARLAKGRAYGYRAAMGAGRAGGAAKLLTEGVESPGLKKLVIPAAVAGGVLGAVDKALEMQELKDPKLRAKTKAYFMDRPSVWASRGYIAPEEASIVKSQQKKAGIDVSNDAADGLMGRNPEAVWTEGVERAAVDQKQAVMEALFGHSHEMHRRAEEQLGDLFSFSGNSYGRARAIGIPAEQASRLVDRAFGGRTR